MRCALHVAGVSFALLLLGGGVLQAQRLPGPVLSVGTAAGQTIFRQGERIALELRFTGPEKRFEANTATYDRSGRMSYEAFEVQPGKGWADPLAGYLAVGTSMGGGLSGVAVLSPEKPFTMPLDLNEWVRFDAPGVYEVTVVSRRISEPGKGQAFGGAGSIVVRSNAVRLEIVTAEPAWQTERLRAIEQALTQAQAAAGRTADFFTKPGSAEAGAVADLRYLGGKGAIEALTAGLRDDLRAREFPSAFGLMGVPEGMRGVALEAMQRRMGDPGFPISDLFLMTMSVLETGSQGGAVRTSEEAGRLMDERERFRAEAWERALAALGRKEGKARALTAQMLLSRPPAAISESSRVQLAAALAGSLAELSEEAQASQLQYRWDDLRSDGMLPRLKTAATLPLKDPGSNEMANYNRRALKAAALQRWYELDPEGAREEVLREIGSAKPQLTAQSLAWFPKQPLPQFGGVWAQALLATEDYQQEQVLAGLLARFGAGAAMAQVRSKLVRKTERLASAPLASLLAYVVEFEPESVGPLVRRAQAQREGCERGCFSTLLQDVSAEAHGPALTDVALEALDDTNADVVQDALNYLTLYGDERARALVTERYFAWTKRWAGRGAEFDHREAGSIGAANWQEMNHGLSLGRAVIASQGWIADAETIARVRAACVGEQMCRVLEQFAAMAAAPYRVSLLRANGGENHQVAQYTAKSMELLEAKLRQFPRGTSFVMHVDEVATTDQKRLEMEASAVFTRTGMLLVRAP